MLDEGCKPVDTPIEQNHNVGDAIERAPIDKGRYKGLVGH